jgi:6-phosphogluconolactonase
MKYGSSVSVAVDRKFVYAANYGSNNVSAFSIDRRTGALTPISGSPFLAGTNSTSVAIKGPRNEKRDREE